jgi:hypothetical protein
MRENFQIQYCYSYEYTNVSTFHIGTRNRTKMAIHSHIHELKLCSVTSDLFSTFQNATVVIHVHVLS